MAGTAFKVLAIVFGIVEAVVAFFFIFTLMIQNGIVNSENGIVVLVFLPFVIFSVVFLWIFTILLIIFGVLFVVFLVLAITRR